MFNTEAVAARRHSSALALLPKTFDSLRAVFGHSGPSVLPLSQVPFPRPPPPPHAHTPPTLHPAHTFTSHRSPEVYCSSSWTKVAAGLQVLQKMSGGKADAGQLEEVEGQVDLLAASLPDFLTRQTREGHGQMLRLNRGMDAGVLRERLLSLANGA